MVVKKAKGKVLPKALLTPIPQPKIDRRYSQSDNIFKNQEDFDQAKSYYYEAVIAKKWALLVEHYGLSMNDPDFWKNLSRHLIHDLLPGFFLQKPKGRPVRWKPDTYYELWLAVQQEMRSGKFKSEQAACSSLASKPRWSGFFKPQTSTRSVAHNLYEQYIHAKKTPLARFIQNVCAHGGLSNADNEEIQKNMLKAMQD